MYVISGPQGAAMHSFCAQVQTKIKQNQWNIIRTFVGPYEPHKMLFTFIQTPWVQRFAPSIVILTGEFHKKRT
jgi:hypothetical protein